jgi:hypothetical protein
LARLAARKDRGGCLLLTAVSEYDDRPGPLRDRVLMHHQRWRGELVRAIDMAVAAGELRGDLDARQFSFEINAIALAVQHDMAITDIDAATAHGQRMFDRLLLGYLVQPQPQPLPHQD